MDRKIFLISAAILVIIVTVVSFLILSLVPESAKDTLRMNKAALVYNRGKGFLKTGDYDKATNAFIIAVNQYPDSRFAEKSLRSLASLYQGEGDYVKASYYYKRLLKSFPDIKDALGIKTAMEKLNMDILFSPAITEDSVEYEVQPGDTLYGIANKFNTTIALVKKINKLRADVIRPGQKLKINISKFSMLVDKSLNILILKKDGEPFKTYAVSTGENNSTPVGEFNMEEKSIKPPWYRSDGKLIMPDSNEYELGERWMGLSAAGYGIHGTEDESTIGRQMTKGCIRMRNVDVIELFDIVPAGTKVEIVD